MSYVDERLLADEENRQKTFINVPTPNPNLGYDVIPPAGTVPKRVIMQALHMAILKKLEEAGSTYNGSTNEKGERHGQGKITYIDGSTYEGSFFNGVRHGQGTAINKEGLFRGQYAHDVRDGQGELTLPSGDILQGTWKNDKKDGEFFKICKTSQQRTPKIFYNDVEIDLADQNPDQFDRAWLGFLFIFLTFIFYYIYLQVKGTKDDVALLVFAGLMLCAYIIEALFVAKTMTYLTKTRSYEEIHKYIDDGRTKCPIIEWEIECYHNHRHDGKTKKVVTHRAKQNFLYYEWLDKTPDSSNLGFFQRYSFVRMAFSINIELTPPAAHSHEVQEAQFKCENTRDEHQNFFTKKTFEGLESDMTMLTGSRPILFYPFFYVLFTLAGLSWMYRIIFTLSTRRAKFDYHKLILK